MKAAYLALIHYPVYNNSGEVVATAVTNLDVHDLSRLALTYGCSGLFVVTPLELQQKLVRRLVRHWQEGRGAGFNITRKRAFELVRLAGSIDEAREMIIGEHGEDPKVIATTAKEFKCAFTYRQMGSVMKNDPGVWLILFGTGWGMTREFIESEADYVLKPIPGECDYNHLSVRTAAAIILDRLLRD